MPLKAIRRVLEDNPERAQALVEVEDKIIERAQRAETSRTSRAEAERRYGIPREALERLEEIGVLTPNSRGYGELDARMLEAISRFRAGGYDAEIGFTVYDTLRYKDALERLVKEEVEVVLERLAGDVEPDRIVELLEAGTEPLRDLIAAMHSKLLVEELRRHRDSRG